MKLPISHRFLRVVTACAMLVALDAPSRAEDLTFNGNGTVPPRWTVDELAVLLREFSAHGNVPIFNLEIAQDGAVSEDVIEMLGRAGGRRR